MFLRILLLLTVIPALELYLLLQIGSLLGPTPTLLLILLTGVVGAHFAKREGWGVLMTLQQDLTRGLPPADRVMEGVLVLLGGLLLITPGVVTDLLGFVLLVRPTRRLLAPRLLKALSSRFQVESFGMPDPSEPFAQPRPQARRSERQVGGSPFSNPFDDLP